MMADIALYIRLFYATAKNCKLKRVKIYIHFV